MTSKKPAKTDKSAFERKLQDAKRKDSYDKSFKSKKVEETERSKAVPKKEFAKKEYPKKEQKFNYNENLNKQPDRIALNPFYREPKKSPIPVELPNRSFNYNDVLNSRIHPPR